MIIRLYLDEDAMRHSLIHALRSRGVDLITAAEIGMLEASDAAQLEFAATQGRVLYSYNVGDFYHLHTLYLTEGKPHAGIILAPQQRYSTGEQMRRILKLAAAKSAETMQNSLEFLSDWS